MIPATVRQLSPLFKAATLHLNAQPWLPERLAARASPGTDNDNNDGSQLRRPRTGDAP
jgi:hypothetical protein